MVHGAGWRRNRRLQLVNFGATLRQKPDRVPVPHYESSEQQETAMTQHLACPACRRPLKAKPELGGLTVKCNKCGRLITTSALQSPFLWREQNTPPLDFVPTGAASSKEQVTAKPGELTKRFCALLIEDNENDAILMEELFRGVRSTFEMVRVDRLGTGLTRLSQSGIDIVLLDLTLPDSQGLETLERTRAHAPGVPVVVLTDKGERAMGNRAVRLGAQDFLVKGHFDGNLLGRSLRYAIERKRRQRAERIVEANELKLTVAREIQQALLPVRDPEVAGFDISGASLATDAVGGDYFDYIRLSCGCLGIVVGDATGHGFGSALIITQTQASVRALALRHSGAGEILTLANQALTDGFPQSRFVTLFLACLDPLKRSLVYSSAGHPEAYILGSAGELKARLTSNNLPLGLSPKETFRESQSIHLKPEDIVLIVTDGVLETKGIAGESFGVERILNEIRGVRRYPAREIVHHLLQSVQDFSRDLPLPDDVTAVVIKCVA
jgi:serine phosphatase RsbU (regulator of sigma subunit)